FGINSILYQRGIYPSETFTRVQKYGLTLLVTTDPELIKYLNNVVEQLKEWLYKCTVQKLVVVISNIESGEVLERWQFDIECDKTAKDDRCIEAGAGGEVGDLGYSLWSWKLVMGHGESHEAKKMMKSESQMTSPLE
ncbi:Mitotic spindle assembly checkpoint protein MAD2A, partial [Eschrichtius robustus]|nr:Mitotic spindle assembly checkpoint protein MAD2A [Eschrichtius robustus]